MRFDLNTDLWKHLSHFDREETFKFVTWNYRIYWLTWKCLSVGVQEGDSFYRNLQHLTLPRATRQALRKRAGLSWNLDVWEGWRMTSERISKLWGIAKAAKWHLLTYFSHAWVLKTRQIEKKDPKIQKISQNPKNQNNSENVSLKIRPCRPWKLGPLFSHEKTTFKWSIVFSEAVFSTN